MNIRACSIADLHHEQPLRVQIDDRALLIVLLDGVPHAMSDTCPHNGASLSQGVLREGCITCPAHFWRFSVRDGTKQSDPRVTVPTYPCWIEGDAIMVDLPPIEPPRSMREILLAHARAGRMEERDG